MRPRPSMSVLAVVFASLAWLGPATAQAPVTSAQSGWKIETRRPGAAAWTEKGKYASAERARSAADGLYRDGLQVRLTKYQSLILRRPPVAKSAPAPSLPAAIGWPQAVTVFRRMQALENRGVAFHFPADGCYARAHLMVQEMRRMGRRPWKVWAKQNGQEALWAATKNHPRGHVTWRWHVAPVLRVKLSSGKTTWLVFDPALFSRPRTLRQWQQAQKRPGAAVNPILEVLPVGRPPLWQGKRIGQGYTIQDRTPIADLDAAAWAKMREYKPYEGRWHPKLDKNAPPWAKPTLAARAPTVAPPGKYSYNDVGAPPPVPQ